MRCDELAWNIVLTRRSESFNVEESGFEKGPWLPTGVAQLPPGPGAPGVEGPRAPRAWDSSPRALART